MSNVLDPSTFRARLATANRLAILKLQYRDLAQVEESARLEVAAAIEAIDESEGDANRGDLEWLKADLDTALKNYGTAMADLIRGEASS
jgi:multidrug resistance efflux pump